MANRILHPVPSHKICRSARSVCSLKARRSWLQAEPQVAIHLLAFDRRVQGRQFALRERSLHIYRQSRGAASSDRLGGISSRYQLRPHALSQQWIVGGHHNMPRAAAAKFAGKGAGAENQRKKRRNEHRADAEGFTTDPLQILAPSDQQCLTHPLSPLPSV